MDGSSGGCRFNELKRNVGDHDAGQPNIPLKKTCVHPLYLSQCIVRQPSAVLGVSPIAPSVGHLEFVSLIGLSVGQSQRRSNSENDGDNVLLTSQSGNPINVNTVSVPSDEHHDDVGYGVHIGGVCISMPDK
ncbi:hypothetical protein Tco_0372686, partial [Tanacetum coccineum]